LVLYHNLKFLLKPNHSFQVLLQRLLLCHLDCGTSDQESRECLKT
jgi:hypothetical protein